MRKAALGIGIGAVAIIAMHVGLVITNDLAGNSWPVRPMTKDIKDMPNNMGDWTVVEAGDIDSRVFAKLDATEAEQRTYENSKGNRAYYHGSVFEHFVRGVPHSPLVCYPAQGWDLLDQTPLQITLPDGASFKATLATFEKSEEKTLVLFWFQFGDLAVVDNEEMRAALEEYRSRGEWPSTVKVIIQMAADSNIQNTDPLQDLALHVYEYTRTLQDGKVPSSVTMKEDVLYAF